jgi:energy-coupling factor transporter ATP-binding protein EcfA2
MTGPSFNPFPGLRPFEDADAKYFFGRDEQVDQLLKRLQRDQRFVGVVGQSGCGKSSLVRAGLLPVLYAGFMARAGSSWRVALMRPSDAGGDKPLESLAQALERSGVIEGIADEKAARIGQTIATLLGGARGLVEVVQQARLNADENVLIVVDQFEELFRFRHSLGAAYVSDEAAAFVKLLLEASKYRDPQTDAPLPVYVLITMRSDFIGDCAQFRNLPETLNDGLFLVPRLTRDQLREAIEGPARVARAEMAPRLVNRLLNEPALGDNPDELPVLQHALMRVWDIWAAKKLPERPIDVEDYDATGGLEKALSIHGDEILTSLPGDRMRVVAERVFKALTERGGDNRGVRRPTKVVDLLAVTDATAEEVKGVVDAFRARAVSFLMPPEQRALGDSTMIDLTHEALMRNWARLAKWVDQEAEAAKEYQRVRDAEEEHARGREGLLVDPRLSAAEEWRERNHPTEAWAKRYGGDVVAVLAYIEESRRAANAEAERRQQAQRREARLRLVPVMAAITVVAIVASIFAIGFASVAKRQSGIAAYQSQRAATLAQKNAALALQRARVALETERHERSLEMKAVSAERQADKARARMAVALGLAQTAEAQASAARAQVALYAQRQANINRSLALAGIDHALYTYGRNSGADRLAIGDNRVAGLVGADAYAASPTGGAKSVLLSAAVTSGAIGRVALPPWNLGAITGRGEYAVVLAGARQRYYAQPVTGSLVSVDVLTLAVRSRLANVRAQLMCGFDSQPRVAAAAGDGIASYAVSDDGAIARAGFLRAGSVRALACLDDGRLLYVDGARRLRVASISGSRSVTIGRVDGNANGIAVSSPVQLAAVTTDSGDVDIYDLRTRRLVAHRLLFTNPAQDCIVAAGCAGTIAFNWDTGHKAWDVAWYDAGKVHVEAVRSTTDDEYACPASACEHAAITYRPGDTLPTIVGGRQGPTYYDTAQKSYASEYSDGAGSQRHPLFDSEFNMYVTPYDPTVATQQNPFGSGLAAQSFVLVQGPMIGTLPAPQWSSPGLVGHDMIIPTTTGLARFDLDHLRASFNRLIDVSYRVQMRDSGDNQHAVTFDWQSGWVRILDIRPWPVRVLHAFRVSPIPVNRTTHFYTHEMQIGYDPHSGVVTMLSYLPNNDVLRLARYNSQGRLLSSIAGAKLMAHAKARVGSVVLLALSDRGNYLVMKLEEPSPDVVMRSDGTLAGTAYSIDGFSEDETTAIASGRSGDRIETIYHLPDWSIEGLNPGLPSSSEYVSMSPDGQTIAYGTYDSSNSAYYLHLYDVPSRTTYSVDLPTPPNMTSFRSISFSADSRYLLVTYNDTGKPNPGHVLAVYAMDPSAWTRAACLMAGRSLTAQEFHQLVGPQVPYRDGCAPYVNEMYRW